MKFILSLFALFLFFAFALMEAAKGITYSPTAQTTVAAPSEPTKASDLTIAQTPAEEKAGSSL